MKKLILTIALSAMTIGLAACAGTENAKDIYSKAITAAEEMESAEVTIEMKQEMKIPGETHVVKMESNMETAMIIDPIAMHQKGTTSINMGEMSEVPMEIEQELYLVDNEIYMFDPMTNQWMNMDASMLPMDMVNNQQMDVTKQLDMMNDYVEEFSLNESEDEYILNFSVDGEGVTALSEDFMKEIFPEDMAAHLGEDVVDLLENVDINELYIEMEINKDTYHMSFYNIVMDMTITQDGEEMNISQDVKATYNSINSIKDIEVPQEVKDSAVDAQGI